MNAINVLRPLKARATSRKLTIIGLVLIILITAGVVWFRHDTARTTPTPKANIPASASIAITDSGFSPGHITIARGTAVKWSNTGASAHALDPAKGSTGPHSPQLQPGESYDYTFAKAGSYRYIDVMQPTHGGTITVNN